MYVDLFPSAISEKGLVAILQPILDQVSQVYTMVSPSPYKFAESARAMWRYE